MSEEKCRIILISAFVVTAILTVSILIWSFRNDRSSTEPYNLFVEDQTDTHEFGDGREVKCDGETSIKGGEDNVFKFVCDGETLVAEKFASKTYRDLITLANNMNNKMFNLVIVQVYIGEGKWAMFRLYAENLQEDFPKRCLEGDYEKIGECPNHILIWERPLETVPINTGNA